MYHVDEVFGVVENLAVTLAPRLLTLLSNTFFFYSNIIVCDKHCTVCSCKSQ